MRQVEGESGYADLHPPYSYLTPRDVAHCVLAWKVSGPWVFPHMTHRGITDCALQQGILKHLQDAFHDMLKEIADEPGSNFHVIDRGKSLQPVVCAVRDSDFALWRDEIHPSSVPGETTRCDPPEWRENRGGQGVVSARFPFDNGSGRRAWHISESPVRFVRAGVNVSSHPGTSLATS